MVRCDFRLWQQRENIHHEEKKKTRRSRRRRRRALPVWGVPEQRHPQKRCLPVADTLLVRRLSDERTKNFREPSWPSWWKLLSLFHKLKSHPEWRPVHCVTILAGGRWRDCPQNTFTGYSRHPRRWPAPHPPAVSLRPPPAAAAPAVAGSRRRAAGFGNGTPPWPWRAAPAGRR
jgi:hypothetical protein